MDQIESHMHPMFLDSVDKIGTRVIEIPGGFTSVSLPCDVDVFKDFKTRLVDLCQQRKFADYTRFGGTGKIPTPDRNKY